jgi:uncharacterized protein
MLRSPVLKLLRGGRLQLCIRLFCQYGERNARRGGAMDGEPRFLVDAMLGSLAKWLRILGYDTLYDSSFDDHRLARLARSEDRLLLTRDTGLVCQRGFRSLWVVSERLTDQLAQVIRECALRINRPFSRCPVCNDPLEVVPKDEAWGQVPPFVFQTQDQFSLCPKCNRFYWRGTHWQQMVARVTQVTQN